MTYLEIDLFLKVLTRIYFQTNKMALSWIMNNCLRIRVNKDFCFVNEDNKAHRGCITFFELYTVIISRLESF